MFTIQGVDNIYFEKSKTYFKEVLSSFFNGNYRSAIVLLYSVVICDICLKLNELSSVYNDTTAKTILEEIENTRNSQNKSSWEKELVDKVYNKQLINSKLFSDINHLYSDRCFSAHPSLDENYELQTPSKEMTIAHIKNILEELLVAPPTFNKNMIDRITDDLEQRKNTFSDEGKIESFLDSAYYSRMTEPAKESLFKSFWVLCFNKPDDERCKNNQEINRKALLFLYFKNSHLPEALKNKDFGFTFSVSDWCLSNLCFFLSASDMFKYIKPIDIPLIKTHVDKHLDLMFISWFLYSEFNAFTAFIFSTAKTLTNVKLDETTIMLLKDKFCSEGNLKEYLDLCIVLFNSSYDFYITVDLYNKYIRPNLIYFDDLQLEEVLNVINSNRCIHACYSFDPSEIYRTYKSKTGKNPDFKKYLFLKKNPEFLTPEDDDNSIK